MDFRVLPLVARSTGSGLLRIRRPGFVGSELGGLSFRHQLVPVEQDDDPLGAHLDLKRALQRRRDAQRDLRRSVEEGRQAPRPDHPVVLLDRIRVR